ncbi:hypothetical protein LIER_33541 [Lithospermum erythrorhizon]|uniref:Uncharacterized protein n=1 Tax=Lithospermum erythrorhizon TaxID=34254 RepID=A0AAV3RX05_LITER
MMDNQGAQLQQKDGCFTLLSPSVTSKKALVHYTRYYLKQCTCMVTSSTMQSNDSHGKTKKGEEAQNCAESAYSEGK